MRKLFVGLLIVAGAAPLSFFVTSAVIDRATPPATPNAERVINLAFAAGSTDAKKYLGQGWSAPESWGAWSDGPRAVIDLPVPARANAGFKLTINATAFVVPPSVPRQRVLLAMNGRSIGQITYQREGSEARLIEVAAGAYRPGASNQLVFDLPDHASPARLGISADTRRLALGIRSVEVRYPVYELYDSE